MSRKQPPRGFDLGDPDPQEVAEFVRGAGAVPPTRAIGDAALSERAANLTTPNPTAPHHTTPHPWIDANPRILKNYNLKLPEPLHAKLAWLSECGHGSIAKIMTAGICAEAERLLREHGITDA
jgi:hypothetical protein